MKGNTYLNYGDLMDMMFYIRNDKRQHRYGGEIKNNVTDHIQVRSATQGILCTMTEIEKILDAAIILYGIECLDKDVTLLGRRIPGSEVRLLRSGSIFIR